MRGRVAWVLLAFLVVATSCGGAGAPASPTAKAALNLSGRYRVSSGGGALAVVQALTKKFSEAHPEVLWDIENVGSDAAVASVQSIEADLGAVSRELLPAEETKVAKLIIGVSGTAVAVNAQNPLTALTKAQVRDIFSGAVTQWSQVGGASTLIKVFVREPTAATREVFDAYVFDGKATYGKDVIPVDSKDQTLKSLYSFKDAVSMLTLEKAALDDPQLRLLTIDGIAATLDNLKSGTYKMRRPLYLVYDPSPQKVKPAIAAFVDFVKGPEGQAIVNK